MTVYVKQLLRRYVALLTCLLLLFSMVIPHHHHRDGTPCCQSIEWEHSHGDESADSHHTSCEGHNLAVIDNHQDDTFHEYLLIPFHILFDYVCPVEEIYYSQLKEYLDVFFIESLYDAWLYKAVGLRAPPMA